MFRNTTNCEIRKISETNTKSASSYLKFPKISTHANNLCTHLWKYATLIATRPVQPRWKLLMNDHFFTALIAASGDPEAGTTFHEASGRIWAFCKRNATLRNATIHYRNTNRRKSNWKSRWNNVATLTLKPNWVKIIISNNSYVNATVWTKSYFKCFNTLKLNKSNDSII